MKHLKSKPRVLALAITVLLIAIVGTIILGGGFASERSPYAVTARTAHIYGINSATQMERVSMTVSITNNSPNVLQISPGLQMQVVDTSGQSHPMTAEYLPPGQIVGGPLQPGATWTHDVDFNLAAGETPAKFIFQPDAASPATEVEL